MITRVDLDYNISILNQLYSDYVEYIDSLEFLDTESENEYTTDEVLISEVNKCTYSSIQYLEELKKDSLKEYTLILKQDMTIFNICFEIYGEIDDDIFDNFITANDLQAFDRNDIDPNDPILHKGMEITYYK